MQRVELEICCYSVDSVIMAQSAGADRVELCAGFTEGGITPSAGAIKTALMNQIDCYVMIRPRGGDFYYSEAEISQMRRDIDYARDCGAHGIVLGLLRQKGDIDVINLRTLLAHAGDMKVTFHRAFDMVRNPKEALETLIAEGCHRILTSGCKATAIEGLELIKELVEQSQNRIGIMAGSGVNYKNVKNFIEAGVQSVHFSAKKIIGSPMIFRRTDVPIMQSSGMTDYDLVSVDGSSILDMLWQMKQAGARD